MTSSPTAAVEATATPTTTNGEIHARYKTTATDLYSRRSRGQRTGRGPRADPRQLGVFWRGGNQHTAIDCRDDPKHRPRTDPRRRAGPHAVAVREGQRRNLDV